MCEWHSAERIRPGLDLTLAQGAAPIGLEIVSNVPPQSIVGLRFVWLQTSKASARCSVDADGAVFLAHTSCQRFDDGQSSAFGRPSQVRDAIHEERIVDLAWRKAQLLPQLEKGAKLFPVKLSLAYNRA
jgi:hypothetical protein